ncbi:cyclophilin-like fold protein [Anaerostipes sp.]|uniref:cyclophilin-like fold protein n=1 Tax=Anaerostipes sp. TaxID=1872530 RepID=UPI00257DD4CE|nr:cyclophilin-like fold protein [Anaerostipes sp.]
MRKIVLSIIMALLLTAGAAGCARTETSEEKESSVSEENQGTEEQTENETNGPAASDGAEMQTEDPEMPTRVIEDGTKINMYFGDTVVPGILNDSETAQALIEMLPYTVHMNRYSHDFCGVMDDPLPYKEEDVHYGWLNGDIDFATDADYFTILFEDEESSEQYGYQVNIGVIDCPLENISKLTGSYDVRIELAEE